MSEKNVPVSDTAPAKPPTSSYGRMLLTSILMVLVLTVLLGIVYPLVTMGVGQILFNHQANGSLIKNSKGQVIGSSLIGQPFTKLKYFWPRQSYVQYNTEKMSEANLIPNSAGTNYGPTNSALIHSTVAYANMIRRVNHLPQTYVLPADAVSTSASGLDPDISPAYASIQVSRVAHVRHLKPSRVQALVADNTSGRTLGFLGQARVNVLELNIALDNLNNK